MRFVSLASFLFVFWLALSGHYTPMLLIAGAASMVTCMLAALRMRVVDAEGHPIELFRGALVYWPWLAREILASGWQVTKIILSPRLSISPTLIDIEASQKTNAGRATYANSITLTPGTITVGVSDHTFTVHSLTREGADSLEQRVMDARVRRLEISS